MRGMKTINVVRFTLVWSTSIEVNHGFTVRQACELVGISESQYYRWRRELAPIYGSHLVFPQRFIDGYKGNRTPEHVEDAVIRLAQTGRFAYATEVSAYLLHWKAIKVRPATVRSILRRAGLYGKIEVENEGSGAKRTWSGIRPDGQGKTDLNPPHSPLTNKKGANTLIFKVI